MSITVYSKRSDHSYTIKDNSIVNTRVLVVAPLYVCSIYIDCKWFLNLTSYSIYNERIELVDSLVALPNLYSSIESYVYSSKQIE